MGRGRLSQVLAAIAGVLLAPVLASAQASIAGVVRDASNAVMPGVTIEVTSPALIEKVRTGVTDGAGQYQVTSLPPGLYTVTFTLASFNTVRREGIELTGSFAAKVDAELRVGALEETVTVTGRSPVVDVQSATRQTVMGREVIDTIPAGRNPNMLGVLIPGITTNNPIQDVGGAESRGGTQPGNTALAIHGGRTGDQIYMQNGVSAVSFDGAFINPLIPNPGGTQEIVLDTAASSVEHYAGGVRINIIPRDGGNIWTGTFFGTFANNSFQSSNVDDDLRALGVTGGEAIKLLMDINPGGGGPIRRDKLWFFGSARFNRADSYAANAFYNLNANKPDQWTYAKDSTRQPSNDVEIKDAQVRLTWQATPSNKVGIVLHEQVNCYCPAVVSALNSFETHSHKALPVERSYAVDWTMPATNRFLVEAGAFYYKGTTNWNPWPGLAPGMISVVEQSTGVNYRSGDAAGERRYGSGPMYGLHSRVAASYITGTHAFKIGFNDTSGTQSFSNMVLMPLKYRFNNGVPNRITQYAYGGDNDPLISKSTIDFNLGVFAQDKWTVKRLTTTYGVRLDWFKSSFPEQTVTPALYAPTRNIVFPAQDNTSWKDVTPRFSAIYDLFGTGKTGIKMSLSKYLENMGTSQDMVAGPNPTRTLVTSAFRSWTDQNGNFVPDCNLLNPASQDNRPTGGDLCGALSDSNFGSVRPGAVYDPELLSGWGKRGYNWELGLGVQHELVSRVALDVSYFRRWYGNFRITDNQVVSESDYDTFSVTAPVDARLPGGGGYVIPNAQDLKPASFGRPAQLFTTLADPYGKQSEYWQGLDVTINARPGERVLLQGGVSGGRTVIDGCDVLQKVPEAKLDVYCRTVTAWSGGTQVKFLGSYTIPKIETRVSATFQDIPGAPISAIYNLPTAVAATTLGRPLSGGAANLPLNLVAPGTMYGDRIRQVDMRFGKIIRYARTRITLNVDLYNAFNGNPVLTQNANFDSWLLPTNILQARFLKLGLQLDF